MTASDFTVMVEGIKRASSPEFLQNNLREWFTNEFGGGHYEEDHKVRRAPSPLRHRPLPSPRPLRRRRAPPSDRRHAPSAARRRCASSWRSSATTASACS